MSGDSEMSGMNYEDLMKFVKENPVRRDKVRFSEMDEEEIDEWDVRVGIRQYVMAMVMSNMKLDDILAVGTRGLTNIMTDLEKWLVRGED